MQEIGIESTLVEEIKKGNKYIEGRLGKPKFLKLREGDELSIREDMWFDGKVIDSSSSSVIVKITQILYFESFIEMLDTVDFNVVIPSAQTANEATDEYKKYYSEEDEKEYGVVAIFFEVLHS